MGLQSLIPCDEVLQAVRDLLDQPEPSRPDQPEELVRSSYWQRAERVVPAVLERFGLDDSTIASNRSPSSATISASAATVHGANDNDTYCPPGSKKEPAYTTTTRTTTAGSRRDPVEVRYPRSKQEEQGHREQWSRLPGVA